MLAVVVVGVGWPGVSIAQVSKPVESAGPAKSLEVGYAGWLVEDSSRHQVMTGVVFTNETPFALVVRAAGSRMSTDEHQTNGDRSYSKDGFQTLVTAGGGVRLLGRLPRATMSLQALVLAGVATTQSTIIIDDEFGKRQSFRRDSSTALLAEVSAGLDVRITERIGVFGTVGVTGPLLHPMYYRMPSVTGGVRVSWPTALRRAKR
jgi:opacity protein-like surface antigen